MAKILEPPFDKKTQDNFNLYQKSLDTHSYTCGNDSSHDLEIANSGLYCPVENCVYKQNWVHSHVNTINYNTIGSWRRNYFKFIKKDKRGSVVDKGSESTNSILEFIEGNNSYINSINIVFKDGTSKIWLGDND